MGGSGSGKTTLLRLIGGQEKAGRRRSVVDGQDVAGQNSAATSSYAMRRRMGMLFQFGALFTDMTVFDNVALMLREHRVAARAHQRSGADEAPRGRPARRGAADAGELSGGMGAAWRWPARSPSTRMLMMYDEPFTGLDPISLVSSAS